MLEHRYEWTHFEICAYSNKIERLRQSAERTHTQRIGSKWKVLNFGTNLFAAFFENFSHDFAIFSLAQFHSAEFVPFFINRFVCSINFMCHVRFISFDLKKKESQLNFFSIITFSNRIFNILSCLRLIANARHDISFFIIIYCDWSG